MPLKIIVKNVQSVNIRHGLGMDVNFKNNFGIAVAIY